MRSVRYRFFSVIIFIYTHTKMRIYIPDRYIIPIHMRIQCTLYTHNIYLLPSYDNGFLSSISACTFFFFYLLYSLRTRLGHCFAPLEARKKHTNNSDRNLNRCERTCQLNRTSDMICTRYFTASRM